MIEWKISKDKYKQHLLCEADDNTQRKKNGNDRKNRCTLNLRTEEAPKQPTQNSSHQKLKAPGLHEDQSGHVIAHVTYAQPLLEGEEEAYQHRGADEDCRLHEYRIV